MDIFVMPKIRGFWYAKSGGAKPLKVGRLPFFDTASFPY